MAIVIFWIAVIVLYLFLAGLVSMFCWHVLRIRDTDKCNAIGAFWPFVILIYLVISLPFWLGEFLGERVWRDL